MAFEYYLMESAEESIRLDMKTDPLKVSDQARWAGVKPGMRVADLGCGSGKTTAILSRFAQPGGSVTGIDISQERVNFAREHYGKEPDEFLCRDIRKPLTDLGRYDLVWIRFVLEYYRTGSFKIVENAARSLKPGGTLCLIDLDYNCLTHYGISDRLERTLHRVMNLAAERNDFDPYVGRKLYSYLYDLGFEQIDVDMSAHHLIYGKLSGIDEFNWTKKVEAAGKNFGDSFPEYRDGYKGFVREFRSFFTSLRRFTYTPVICCKGICPSHP